jgi:hypothetical protein
MLVINQEPPMMLHVRVSRVDDYNGELGQALQKLEVEQAKGVLSREEQDDFLGDLRKAVIQRDLQPMRNRAMLDLLLAATTTFIAALLPWNLGLHHWPLLCLLALCLLGLGLAAWRFSLYARRNRHDQRWLGSLEAKVAAGGTIFDA